MDDDEVYQAAAAVGGDELVGGAPADELADELLGGAPAGEAAVKAELADELVGGAPAGEPAVAKGRAASMKSEPRSPTESPYSAPASTDPYM